MNISKKMQDAFNAQIVAEMWSSNLYLQMSCWFRKEGWKGFSGWMYKQAEEERQHAMDMLSLFFIVVVRLSLPVSMPLRQVGQTLRRLL